MLKVRVEGFADPIGVVFQEPPKLQSIGWAGDADAMEVKLVEVLPGPIKYRGEVVPAPSVES